MLVRALWIKYIINIEVHFVGCLYICGSDLIWRWKVLEVHNRLHKGPPLAILSQLNPAQYHPSCFLCTHCSINTKSRYRPPKWSLSFRYLIIFFSIRATCLSHPILLDAINRRMSGEQYKPRSSFSSSFPHSPVTSSLLDPDIFLSTLFSKTLSLCFP